MLLLLVSLELLASINEASLGFSRRNSKYLPKRNVELLKSCVGSLIRRSFMYVSE